MLVFANLIGIKIAVLQIESHENLIIHLKTIKTIHESK